MDGEIDGLYKFMQNSKRNDSKRKIVKLLTHMDMGKYDSNNYKTKFGTLENSVMKTHD